MILHPPPHHGEAATVSWSITVPSMPCADAIAAVHGTAASQPSFPQPVAEMVIGQLEAMPVGTIVSISSYGHFWGESQVGGEASCHFSINATAPVKD